MDDDLDMSMRAPYISMSESSELPMLIAEDLMWGAQPDIKQTLNMNKKIEMNDNNQQAENIACQIKSGASYQQQRSTMESSLASLLCNQLLQHQKQQIQDQQTEQPIIQNSHQDLKAQIFDQVGNVTLVNSNTLMIQNNVAMGLLRNDFQVEAILDCNEFFFNFSSRS